MIFSIAMGAEYLSYVKSIATFAPTFYGYIISVLVSVLLLIKKLEIEKTKPTFIKSCILGGLGFFDFQLFY